MVDLQDEGVSTQAEQIAHDAEQIHDAEVYKESSKVGDIIKSVWICLQVAMMTFFMIRGIRNYNKKIKGWYKIKSLFVFQFLVILFLLINEFTQRDFAGIFFLVLASQWTYFVTFSLVIDSCITTKDDETMNQDRLKTFNWWFRVVVHLISLGLFLSVFFVRSCDNLIYPANFAMLSILVITHQVYDIILAGNGYMINWEELPQTSRDKLRYNKELFQKQTKFLFLGNLVFGIIALLIVCFGYLIINKQDLPGHNQHILCFKSSEWIYLTWEGNIFGTLHQFLILMSINFQIMVLVRIPFNMGIFEDDIQHEVKASMQLKLLKSLNLKGGVTKPLLAHPAEQAAQTANPDDGFVNADSINRPRRVTMQQLHQNLTETHHKANDNFRV